MSTGKILREIEERLDSVYGQLLDVLDKALLLEGSSEEVDERDVYAILYLCGVCANKLREIARVVRKH